MSRLRELIAELCPDGVEYKQFSEVIGRNREKGRRFPDITKVYAVTNSLGIIASDEYERRDVTSSNTGNYGVLRAGMFAYNPSRIDVGSIGMLPIGSEPGLVSPLYVVFSVIDESLDLRFVEHFIASAYTRNVIVGRLEVGARNRFDFENWKYLRIPVPPIEVQREIVRILDSFQELDDELSAEIEAREKQYRYAQERCFVKYFGDPAAIDESRHGVKLGDLFIVGSAKRVYQSEQAPEGVPFLRVSDLVSIIDGSPVVPDLYISEEKYQELSEQGYVPSPGDILVTARGTLGRYYFISKEDRFYFQDGMITWLKRTDQSPSESYFAALFSNERFLEKLIANCGQGTVRYLSIKGLANTPVPKVGAEELRLFDQEMAEVDSLSQLTHELRFERDARRKQFEHYRDRLLAFPEKVA